MLLLEASLEKEAGQKQSNKERLERHGEVEGPGLSHCAKKKTSTTLEK